MKIQKEVILCKDCVYYKHEIMKDLYLGKTPIFDGYICEYFKRVMFENDYCSYGEEKE